MQEHPSARRPLRTRDRPWAKALAGWLARAGVAPNVISLASIAFAALASAGLLLATGTGPVTRCLLLLGAAIAIQLRLLCNMLDGMVAIEGGQASRTGEIYNEAPDRVADVLILVAAGYATTAMDWSPILGWAAALLAVLTAYVRMLGGALGLPQDFRGPMAKQHRMAVMTAGCCGAIAETLAGGRQGWSIWLALIVIVVGSAITARRRLRSILRNIDSDSSAYRKEN